MNHFSVSEGNSRPIWYLFPLVNQAVKLLYLMQSQLKLVDSNMNFTDEVCNSIQFGKHFIKAHVDHLDVLCYVVSKVSEIPPHCLQNEMTKSNNAYNLYLICSGELKLPFSISCQKGNQNLYIGTVKVYKHERGKNILHFNKVTIYIFCLTILNQILFWSISGLSMNWSC